MESIMTKLPERNILDGSTLPKTTTGEMKGALGKIRDYLFELFGDDSADKEAARLSLGIDLDGLNGRLSGKAERTELEALQDEIGKRGVPIGSIDYVATTTSPTGYLKADGAAVGRETYPDLFAAIGTTFGEGDGSTTFNLPDLMGRFAEGSATPGTVKAAGLPNVTGTLDAVGTSSKNYEPSGPFYHLIAGDGMTYATIPDATVDLASLQFDLRRANPIYGASDTVQPPSLTLLPCIKAFDVAANPALIDVSQLAQDVVELSTGKIDKTVEGKPVRYLVDAYNDGMNWWRKWSDGWIEQGGRLGYRDSYTIVNLLQPFADANYCVLATFNYGVETAPHYWNMTIINDTRRVNYFSIFVKDDTGNMSTQPMDWLACGQGAVS